MFSEVIRPIERGISAVIERKLALTKVLFLPLAIVLALMLLADSISVPISAIMLGANVFAVIIYGVVVPVTVHRMIILDEKAESFSSTITFGKRELEFLGAVIASILYCLPAAVFLFIPEFGIHITDVVASYILSRISLMFPSVAIGERMDALDSWRATENHQVMMFTVVFLFAKFFVFLEWGISKLGMPGIFVSVFSFVFLVSALSEAYKIIKSEGKLLEAKSDHDI